MLTSKETGLLNDFTTALGQQLFFWGCDVLHPEGNLLCEFGLKRHESLESNRSSCYRMLYNGDLIELHGLCVGRYSKEKESFLYTRRYRRPWLYYSDQPPRPGQYDKNLIKNITCYEVREAALYFLEWWLEYELWISKNTSSDYRENCYQSFKRLPTSKVWLRPEAGLSWLRAYAQNPKGLKRSREWL